MDSACETSFILPPEVAAMRKEADLAFNDAVEHQPIRRWEERVISDLSVPVRIYFPDEGAGRPLLLYFHGGGFVLHNLASHDSLCRRLAVCMGCVVVSVGYRLAPEHPYPAALHDGYAALRWAHDHALELGCDPLQILVGGDSAGATLSAALSIDVRNRKGPPIAAQLLFYGSFGCIPYEASASVREYGDGKHILTKETMEWFDRQYLRDCAPDVLSEPTCRPGTAADLSGLPPALVVTAWMDPLRDDGEAYARRLLEAGNLVKQRRFEGMLHGFLLCWEQYESVREAMDVIAADVRQLLQPTEADFSQKPLRAPAKPADSM